MMATTHALVGVAVASLLVLNSPEHAGVAMVAAFAGGVFPDLDLYVGHRKTLHFPVFYWLGLAFAGLWLATAGGVVALALFFLLLGAALHSTMDIFGGGLELKPWEASSERAVYNHARKRWHRPRRWIRYDGAPEDALLATTVAIPPLLVADGSIELLVGGAVLLSLAYSLLRRRVPAFSKRVLGYIPAPLYGYVPERFIDG